MKRYLIAASAAGVVALGVSVAAQNPSATPQTPPTRTPTAQTQPMATVEGCLMREQDVPGRKPNVAERAGIAEDYILTNAKVVKGSAPPTTTPPAKPGEATGTSGTLAPMYDVKGIDADRLKPLVGKRVEIEGTFADLDKSPSASPTEDLVDIRGTTIRQTSGECQPK